MMKFNELIETRQFVIACDLDGVLVNFVDMASKVTGIKIDEGDLDAMDTVDKNEFWGIIERHVASGGQFFGKMKPMPDAMELWHYISKHPHFILTAAGKRLPTADREKREWVKKHLNQSAHVEVVESAKAKARFATPFTILIDDREKATVPFQQAGGISILHKNAASTIKQLKKFGL